MNEVFSTPTDVQKDSWCRIRKHRTIQLQLLGMQFMPANKFWLINGSGSTLIVKKNTVDDHSETAWENLLKRLSEKIDAFKKKDRADLHDANGTTANRIRSLLFLGMKVTPGQHLVCYKHANTELQVPIASIGAYTNEAWENALESINECIKLVKSKDSLTLADIMRSRLYFQIISEVKIKPQSQTQSL